MFRTSNLRRLSWVLAIALPAGGCGPRLAEVSGSVAYNGQPVKKGSVCFVCDDGHGPTAAALIQDGQYSLRVLPGQCKVEILAYKKVGQRRVSEGNPKSPMMDIDQQLLPDWYNVKTRLTREVKPGRQQIDFTLTE